MAPPRRGDLSPEEKDLLGVISRGNTEEAGMLLGSKNVRVNCLDEGAAEIFRIIAEGQSRGSMFF